MSQSAYPAVPKLPAAEQAVYDALLGLQRNGKPDATAPELRETIERLGLYQVKGHPVQRIEKGWVTGRLSELAARGMVVKCQEQRRNPLTGKLVAPWAIPARQGDLVGFRSASVSTGSGPDRRITSTSQLKA